MLEKHILDKRLFAFKGILLTLLTLLLLLKAFTTLNWRMEHDTPLLHYTAFLMDKYELVPYRDIFETSMPGTFAFHYSIGKLFGYGDTSFRWDFQRKLTLDLLKCGAICAVSFLIPIIITLVWLAANSALNPFMNIFFNYLPLHSTMTQWHANIPRFNYLLYLIESTFKFGGYGVLFLCSL
ncbi:hypothetical protein K8T06_11695, partial [bacterium]|nr:hypothetical protein [bacterium]